MESAHTNDRGLGRTTTVGVSSPLPSVAVLGPFLQGPSLPPAFLPAPCPCLFPSGLVPKLAFALHLQQRQQQWLAGVVACPKQPHPHAQKGKMHTGTSCRASISSSPPSSSPHSRVGLWGAGKDTRCHAACNACHIYTLVDCWCWSARDVHVARAVPVSACCQVLAASGSIGRHNAAPRIQRWRKWL